MLSVGIFLDKCDERIASFGHFPVLSQLRCCLKFGEADVWRRSRSNFPTLLFFHRDFLFYKSVITKPRRAAEDEQRQQQDEKPLHAWQNVVKTSSTIRGSRRTNKHQGNTRSITRRIVCEESIAATYIGFAYAAPVPDSLPGKKRC